MTESAKRAFGSQIQTLQLKTTRRTEWLNITREVIRCVATSGIPAGVCHLYVPHTTAGITINEGDDPDVARDMEAALDRMVPRDSGYKHCEGNSDSHIKASLVGSSQSVLIENGELRLGRWQAIFFCEFDGPRTRNVRVKIQPDFGPQPHRRVRPKSNAFPRVVELMGRSLVDSQIGNTTSRQYLPVQPVDATPSDLNLFTKGGV